MKNRVHEIRELTDMHNWRYCPIHENPADLLTRSIFANQYKFNGLSISSRWPTWKPQEKSVLTMTTVTND